MQVGRVHTPKWLEWLIYFSVRLPPKLAEIDLYPMRLSMARALTLIRMARVFTNSLSTA